jgi:hypothetical protein
MLSIASCRDILNSGWFVENESIAHCAQAECYFQTHMVKNINPNQFSDQNHRVNSQRKQPQRPVMTSQAPYPRPWLAMQRPWAGVWDCLTIRAFNDLVNLPP